jgi:hypothetical protein
VLGGGALDLRDHRGVEQRVRRAHVPTMTDMTDAADDVRWEAFVLAMLAAGHLTERRSRYADKPALFSGTREIAHLETPGIVDLRITRAGWAQAREEFGSDPAVRRDPSRRDWIELHLADAADVARLGGLLAIAVAANA